MSRSTKYTYDPETGKWTKSTSDSSTTKTTNKTTNNKTTTTNTTKPTTDKTTTNNTKTTTTKTSGDNLKTTSPDKNTSDGEVEKKYNDIQINTLEGTLKFIATKETIKLRAGDTVKLNGLGKYLSGNYYVKELTRCIGSDGYTHSATVIKTDFGESLKTKSKNSTPVKKDSVSSPPTSDNSSRTHTVKKGECLWAIAIKYYGNGSLYKKIYDANTKKIAHPDLIYVGQVFVIP